MKLRPISTALVVLGATLAALALSGCSRLQHQAEQPASNRTETKSLATLSDIATEERIAALSSFAEGLSLDLNNKPAEANEAYWKALLLDPGNEELALDLSRRLLASGEKERAVLLLKSTASQPNSSGAVHAWLALALLQSGQTNEAVQANLSAIKRSPDNFAAYQNLTHIYLQTGKTNEAVKVLDDAASQTDTNPEFKIPIAELYLRLQRENALTETATKERVLELLDRASGQDSENPIVLQRIGDLYVTLGEPAKAIPSYEKLLEEYPGAPGITERLANIYLRTQNREKATEYFEKLRQDRPTDPLTHYLLGSLAFESRDPAKAEEFFETAMRLNPDFEPIYYDLAGAKLSLHKTEEALQVLEKARAKFKLNFTLEYYTGVAKAIQENYAEALTHLTSAELIAKSTEPARLNHQFYYQFGSTHERLGNIPEAVSAFRKGLEIKPDYAEALNYLGYMWADRGENLEEAYDMIKRAVALESDNPAYLDSLAWVLFKMDRPKEALEWMLKAISLTEKPDPTLYDHLGDIHASLKDYDKARDAWSRSLAVEPSDKVKEKIEKIGKLAP